MEEIIHVLQEFWFGPQDMQVVKALPPAVVAAIGVAISAISAAVAAKRARTREEEAKTRRRLASEEIASIEARRQKIIDPWEDVEDLSDIITNPFANLQVATGAAEMQAQQADLSLATTLDVLRAAGASAGGATALAQAALRSKQGVAATIEKQEAENARLRAQGILEMEKLQISEKTRIQEAGAKGKGFVFGAQESRDIAKLNRVAGLQANAQQASMMYGMAGDAAAASAWGAVGGGLVGLAGSDIDWGDWGGGQNTNIIQQSGQVSQTDIQGSVDAFLAGFPGGASGASQPGGGSAAGGLSDRRLKKNIKLIGYAPSGLKIYIFEYINKIFGDGVYQGVMSDEIPQHAVIKHSDGYDRVNYSKIDVKFKKII